MKIDRLYTMEGQDPYESLEFETRSSVIRNPDGSVVTEWKGVVVPRQWSQVAALPRPPAAGHGPCTIPDRSQARDGRGPG